MLESAGQPRTLASAASELRSLHEALAESARALQRRHDEVTAREAAVACREAAVAVAESSAAQQPPAPDEPLLRALLAAEASRLSARGREALEARAGAHVERLERVASLLNRALATALLLPTGAAAPLDGASLDDAAFGGAVDLCVSLPLDDPAAASEETRSSSLSVATTATAVTAAAAGTVPAAARVLPALLLLRLSLRQAGEAGGAGGGGSGTLVSDAVAAVRALQLEGGEEESACAARGELLSLGLAELVEAAGCGHPPLAMASSASLLALLAAPRPVAEAAVEALCTPRFFRVAARVISRDGASRDGDESLAARLCVLLQRLSLRPAARAFFHAPELRGALVGLQHIGPSAPFLTANVRSVLKNTKRYHIAPPTRQDT
ncbi:hypothetical protein EMIHUDRAFT_227375 [Emiliania huxleyi CCMP1516]|uniref:Uncharacterized protein n=2 Tax=Emiliania huxleyi TaxID=2903 RepID=A0A0D3KIM8_EMIH1|nr:hypothetical protein EMIHUDRAFT_227375 [Emiliania huxleyi CCMP1516]EOD35613.1 hypothetical protein EMIHUDRAFT_227375 [Emiliania huxleyi CCMP1516]|eukprot:XP_005788042.1 hypothetical protein EMIHUDRAFT_227375 [Emiliania huxleyi CCMP1516]